MKRVLCLLASTLLSGGVMYAQGEMDAFNYSQPDFNGTARYLSMGGAFGALGGDISVMNTNPGGLAIYRSSEVVTTLSVSTNKNKSTWGSSKNEATKTRVNFDNIGYVGYFPTGNDAGLVSWNVGFSYNRLQNFERSYRASGTQAYSLADYAAAKASYVNRYDDGSWSGIPEADMPLGSNASTAYQSLGGLWVPALAYQAGLIGTYDQGGDEYHSAFGEWADKNTFNPYSPNNMQLDVREKGAVDRYNMALGLNFSNILFMGATISITDLNYDYSSVYDESFGAKDNLYWDSWKSTDGTGYSFNIGAVVRPVDCLRLGLAYNSPTWYKMTDYYGGSAGSYLDGLGQMDGNTPTGVYTDYKLRTPDRVIVSAAAILGTTGLISVDYEISNYKSMKLMDPDGRDYNDNQLIEEDFGLSHAVKVGAEVKVTPQFAVRLGGGWQGTPLKANLKEGAVEVYTSGVTPHYTLYKGTSHFSVGFGYRFTPNFYVDMACVYRDRKDDLYAFSNVYVDGANNESYTVAESTPITLKGKRTQVSLTLGYKF
ncbi:MAG: OmpP1/FadL family transporter [Parabacteroides sp.]